MANINLPSVSELQSLYTSPKTEAISQVPSEVEGALNLADVIKQRQLDRQKQLIALQKQIEEIKQSQAATKAASLAVPITSSTPASTQVPATLGNVANVNPNTGKIEQTGPEIAANAETRRPGLFEQYTLQTQPKEAVNDLLKLQLNQNKQAGQWKLIGTTQTPDGKKHGIMQNPFGETQLRELPEGAELNVEKYPKVRLQQMVGYLNKDFVDDLSLAKAPEAIKRVNNALAGMVRFRPYEDFTRTNGMTPQEFVEMARNIDAITTATGRPTVSITRDLLPPTAQRNFSSVEQFLQSKPIAKDYNEFVDRWEKLRNKETPALENYVKNYQRQIAGTKGYFLKQYAPELYKRTLNQFGIKGEAVKEAGEKITPMFPTNLYGQSGDPEDRFNELISQGLSDDEATAQLAVEGY